MSYQLVYEEENFLIVNKASGLLVHKTKYEQSETLIYQIRADLAKPGVEHYLIHRLDKDTSGLLIIAKNKKAVPLLQGLFRDNLITKEYIAIITSFLPAKEVKIDLSIGRSKSKKLCFSSNNAHKYKPSCTYAYKLEKQLIMLKLLTGRTHQIRAHLFSIKCSILNDPIYGKAIEGDTFGQYLHAYRLTFISPFTKKKLVVTTPAPVEFVNKLEELKISYKLADSTVVEEYNEVGSKSA